MILLLVFCFSLVWVFIVGDEFLYNGEIEVKIKEYVLFFVENGFFLISWLFVIFYFSLEFYVWIVIVMFCYFFILVLVDFIIFFSVVYNNSRKIFLWCWFMFCICWIRDDLCLLFDGEDIGSCRRWFRRM